MQVYRAFGVQRSGNHAVISWLISQFAPHETFFFSGASAGHAPERTYAKLEHDGDVLPASARGSDAARHFLDRAQTCQTIVISYENADITGLADPQTPIAIGYDGDVVRDIIILRSFFNWLASTYKLVARSRDTPQGSAVWHAEMRRRIDLWTTTNATGLALEASHPDRFLVARYDDWFTDPAYMKHLLQRLGLSGGNTRLPRVQNYGGGSSFDQLRYAATPLKMKTTERWTGFVADPDFRQLVSYAMAQPATAALIETQFPDCAAIYAADFRS